MKMTPVIDTNWEITPNAFPNLMQCNQVFSGCGPDPTLRNCGGGGGQIETACNTPVRNPDEVI